MGRKDRLEGRNPVLECLTRQTRAVTRIWLDRGAKPDRRISAILDMAEKRRIPTARVARQQLDQMAEGRVHNGVIAEADPLPDWSAKSLLSHVFDSGEDPFFVLADGLSYEHNLGAILRSSLGFGVNGMFVPTRRGAALTPVVQRVAMGAAEVVPVVRESLFAALKPIKKAGIRVVGADMGGKPMGECHLSGPLALVMGAEGRGLSPKLREKCDAIVSIPLAGDLESLNVSVAAAVLMYEKRRQDGWF